MAQPNVANRQVLTVLQVQRHPRHALILLVYAEFAARRAGQLPRRVVRDAVVMLDRLGEAHGATARYPQLLATFLSAPPIGNRILGY